MGSATGACYVEVKKYIAHPQTKTALWILRKQNVTKLSVPLTAATGMHNHCHTCILLSCVLYDSLGTSQKLRKSMFWMFWIHLFVQFFSFLKFCRTRPFGPVSATPFICIPWKQWLHVYAVLDWMMQPGLLTICIEMKNTTFKSEHTSNTKEKLRPTW